MVSRLGISRARKSTEDRTNYASADPGSSDSVNKLSLFYGNRISEIISSAKTDINGVTVAGTNTNDMIKFRIKSFDNDVATGAGVYMIFRAYLNNVRRNMTSKWNPYNYVGRGESFYVYDGFTETITLQFTIAASTRAEMKPLYQKIGRAHV